MNLYPDLDEYRYSLAQSAELSGTPEKSVRNHMARGVLAVGRKHWLGRYEFNMLDVIRLAFVRLLTDNLSISLDEAASVAEALIPVVRGTAWPTDVLLMARGADGRWEAGSLNHIADNPPGLRRRPHFRFPVAAIVDDLHAQAGITPILQPPANPFALPEEP